MFAKCQPYEGSYLCSSKMFDKCYSHSGPIAVSVALKMLTSTSDDIGKKFQDKK